MTEYSGVEPARESDDRKRNSVAVKILKIVLINAAVVTYFVFATLKYIRRSELIIRLESIASINCDDLQKTNVRRNVA